MTECQTCRMRDDDWFLCTREECPHKAPAAPPKTLRDEFAMAALTGLLAGAYSQTYNLAGHQEELLRESFDLADAAMALRARTRTESEG